MSNASPWTNGSAVPAYDRPYVVLTYYYAVQAYASDRFTGFGLESGDILWKAALLQAKPVE